MVQESKGDVVMKKYLLVLVMVLSLAAAGLGLCCGCASLSEWATPATRHDPTVNYVVESGVADANDYDGYFNLEKARRLATDLTSANAKRVQAIKHQFEDNELLVNQLQGVVTHNLQMAEAREEFLFAEDGGLLSRGLTAGGLGMCTGLWGLMRERPGDLTRDDGEKATVDLREAAGIKDAQFTQGVTGVEKFWKVRKDYQLVSLVGDPDKPALEKIDAVLAVLKTKLAKEQDQTTREAVGAVRASV